MLVLVLVLLWAVLLRAAVVFDGMHCTFRSVVAFGVGVDVTFVGFLFSLLVCNGIGYHIFFYLS